MISPPINDHACLGPTTERILVEVAAGNPVITDLAARFTSTDDLAAWLRSLPQRDDNGDPADGPKVAACRPPQRLDFTNPEPNCFERSSIFCSVAELIAPEHEYRLATINTPNGLHTFPTKDGVPVVLDPRGSTATPRNLPGRNVTGTDVESRKLRLRRLIGLDETKGLRGDLSRAYAAKARGLDTWVNGEPIDEAISSMDKAKADFEAKLAALDGEAATRNALALVGPIVLTPFQAVDWICELARSRAESFPNGLHRVRRGHRAMWGMLIMQPICIGDVRHVAFALALAEREARAHGPAALKVVHSTAHALDRLDQLAAEQRAATSPRNDVFSSMIGAVLSDKSLQPWLSSIVKVGGRLAGDIGVEALKLKLASMGISPQLIGGLEKDLNREGLTLGRFAKPSPMVGSFGAMTPEALAGRWLAGKL